MPQTSELVALAGVAVRAEHLQVLWPGLPALRPGLDVVAAHLLERDLPPGGRGQSPCP